MDKMKKNKNEFHVIIERDSEGFFVGSIPQLQGCHTQAKSLDVLMKRIKEAAELCIEIQGQKIQRHEFIGVQKIAL